MSILHTIRCIINFKLFRYENQPVTVNAKICKYVPKYVMQIMERDWLFSPNRFCLPVTIHMN